MTEYVYRPSRKKDGKTVYSKFYRGRFSVLGNGEVHDVALKTTDKQVAKQLLRQLVAEREREAAGIIAPRPLREAAGRPLLQHLEEYIADLDKRGRDDDYVRHVECRCRTLAAACSWKRLSDVTADSFTAWRSQKAASASTLNQYLDAANSLMRWLMEHERVAANPLAKVRKVEQRGRETFHRRALSVDECRRLLDIAGPRRLAYLLALTTGLRRGEIKDLRWGDVELESEAACLHVRASTSKNHKSATIALRPELVSELTAIRGPNTEPGDFVFPKGVPHYKTVTADLGRAGIPVWDGTGGKVDFHALRHTFCTLLQKSGVSARIAMEMMRHSDMRLTAQVYTDAQALPTREAVMQLPSLTENPPRGPIDDALQNALRNPQPVVLNGNGMLPTVALKKTSKPRKSLQRNTLDAAGDHVSSDVAETKLVLGGGVEPPRLSAHAPQTCVSAIPPPEQGELESVG